MARELPVGIEWPSYEDGGLVEIGDIVPVCGKYEELLQVHLGLYAFTLYTETCDEKHQYGYRLERTVLAADGVPIKVGDTVYFTDGREQECNTVVNAKYDYKGEPYVQLGLLNEAGHPTYTNCFCIDPSQLTHTKPEPKRLCRDCRHWQGDPSASHMGVCFNSYMERCCVDSYAAQLDYAKACEDFEGRGE